MLHSYNDLKTFAIRAVDDRSSKVDDIYFDDSDWHIRYLVAQSGFLLTAHQGLVGARLLDAPDVTKREIPVNLTEEELKSADSPETDPPVSEQDRSTDAHDPGLWPSFLVGTGAPYSPDVAMDQLGLDRSEQSAGTADRRGDPHLRSMAEILDYSVETRDGEVGSVIDFLIEADGWQLRFLAIDTGNWLPGRRVVVTTDWITDVDAVDRKIHVDVDQQTLKDAPRLRSIEDLHLSDAKEAIDRYGHVGYWPV